jgi:DHA3 family tetracycline resistance protein-like MFS transporter
MTRETPDRLRALRPLATRDYRLLFAAVGIEVFGTGMWTIVMVFQVLALDDSPLALSAVATGLSLGLFAFSVLGGVVADRFSKRRIIITVQGLTAAVMTAVAVLSLTGAIELWHVGLASFAMGAGSAFFYPAYSAYLPKYSHPNNCSPRTGSKGLSALDGPGPRTRPRRDHRRGVLPRRWRGHRRRVLRCRVRHHPVPQPPEEAAEPEPSEQRTSVWGDLKAGVRYVARTRWLLWTLIFGSSLALIIQGPIEVLLPFLTRDRFDDAEATFGLLLAAYGIGGAIGSLIVSSLKLPRRYLTLMIGLWGGGTLPLVLIGLANNLAVMLATLFAVGAATGAGVVIWGTLLQRLVPPEMIGRVASLDFFVSIAFMPVSIAIAGPLSLVVPIPAIFIVAGVAPTLLAVVALVAGRMRHVETRQPLDT